MASYKREMQRSVFTNIVTQWISKFFKRAPFNYSRAHVTYTQHAIHNVVVLYGVLKWHNIIINTYFAAFSDPFCFMD